MWLRRGLQWLPRLLFWLLFEIPLTILLLCNVLTTQTETDAMFPRRCYFSPNSSMTPIPWTCLDLMCYSFYLDSTKVIFKASSLAFFSFPRYFPSYFPSSAIFWYSPLSIQAKASELTMQSIRFLIFQSSPILHSSNLGMTRKNKEVTMRFYYTKEHFLKHDLYIA